MRSAPVMPRATSGDETRIIRSSHGDDPFYSRWSREALRGLERLRRRRSASDCSCQAGVLWLAHDEDGCEAPPSATLRTAGIPVERLSPDESAARWPQMRSDDLAFAIFEPEAGLLMARRGRRRRRAHFADEGGRVRARLGASRARPTGAGWSMSSRATAGARPAASSCSPQARGCRASSPTWSATSIRVTKQDVLFVGSPAGDGRFAAESLPCWLDSPARSTASRRSTVGA